MVKRVHLIRHGEAFHNKEGQVEVRLAAGWLLRGGWRRLSMRLVLRMCRSLWRYLVWRLWPLYIWMICAKNAPAKEAPSPYEHADASLTATGWVEVAQLRKQLEETGLLHHIELVVVSPLTRTLQTAAGVFGGGKYTEVEGMPPLMVDGVGRCPGPAISSSTSPSILALDLCREQTGVHPSSKRASISKYRTQFPAVDFSQVEDEEDKMWKPDVRESEEALCARCRALLKWILDRKEPEIAVVSHGGFLSCMLSQYCGTDRRLRWPNCGLRTLTVTDDML